MKVVGTRKNGARGADTGENFVARPVLSRILETLSKD